MKNNHKTIPVCLIIPVYKPDAGLPDLVAKLSTGNYHHILVVNDGSPEACSPLFEAVAVVKGVTLLTHPQNRGKGAALKTAFRFYQEHFAAACHGVVTVDADGQHLPEDVLKIALKLAGENGDELVLGVREFSQDVPLRSKFGNTLTRKVFVLLKQVDIQDTQTGLRGIPDVLLPYYLGLETNQYDFELECLLVTHERGFGFIQIPIQTIYVNDNESSHFNPVRDSIRIYYVFLRHLLFSLSCFLLDLGLFKLSYLLTGSVVLSTYGARSVSLVFNFFLGRYVVFKPVKTGRNTLQFGQYLALAGVIATLSAFFLSLYMHTIGMNIMGGKIMVDLGLFFVGFLIQRYVIFR